MRDGVSPLTRFTSISGMESSQPKQMGWSEERLQSLLDRARGVRVRRNDSTREFLEMRYNSRDRDQDISDWRFYQVARERRHYWGHALCCNYDWDWDLSKSLKRLFYGPKAEGFSVKLSITRDDEWIVKPTTSTSYVPKTLKFEYRTEAGEIRYKTFRADLSHEDFTAQSRASNDNALSLAPEEPDNNSPPSEGELEYVNVLEYREINRHARRKIEEWLNDGWYISWKWNGLYNYKWGDSRWKHDGDKYRSAHWMVLRKSKVYLSSCIPNERPVLRFPKTPKTPPDPKRHRSWIPAEYSASDSNSDST